MRVNDDLAYAITTFLGITDHRQKCCVLILHKTFLKTCSQYHSEIIRKYCKYAIMAEKNNVFLIFDYLLLLKNIRNNWITEKIQELEYVLEGGKKVSKWSHIKTVQIGCK